MILRTAVAVDARQVGVIPFKVGVIPFTSESKTWGPVARLEDALDITATNASHVMIDAARAKVDCHAQLKVTSDGSPMVTLADCPATH